MTEPCQEATAADLDGVVALENTCFAEDPWTRNMLQDELSRPGGIFLVIRAAGRTAAFAIGWAVLDELHILQVAVDPAARRLGLGRQVLTALEARAISADNSWLEVRRDNEAAIGLYEAFDYRAVGCRPKYYTDGCDALLLRKRLRA
ncbi:MAG: ribosomal protein S18-alanine N-acetyltransferase [Pseudomonadota bacterium]|nr:ribosomal protein S18-alanine N-acetyltransferase [Pseudomonadota bacterium]